MAVELPEPTRCEAEILLTTLHPKVGKPLRFIKLKGGANNQVFRVETADSQFCLKWYFSHPGDPRNRLAHEYQFLQYAWSLGIRNIPQPLGVSAAGNLALFSYVPGRPFTLGEIHSRHIQQAAQFLEKLNQDPKSDVASALPIASEACFCWQDHILKVQQRIDRLKELACESILHQKAEEFIHQQLVPHWSSLKTKLENRFMRRGSDLGHRCNRLGRIVSPSDFGFHNAILGREETAFFIDFEYAGWDSPIKLLSDFFHQPEIPIPLTYLDEMIEAVGKFLPNSRSLGEFTRWFLPVYGVKWCCILLNDFLPVHESRRSFSHGQTPTFERLERQLKKAHRKLASLDV